MWVSQGIDPCKFFIMDGKNLNSVFYDMAISDCFCHHLAFWQVNIWPKKKNLISALTKQKNKKTATLHQLKLMESLMVDNGGITVSSPINARKTLYTCVLLYYPAIKHNFKLIAPQTGQLPSVAAFEFWHTLQCSSQVLCFFSLFCFVGLCEDCWNMIKKHPCIMSI